MKKSELKQIIKEEIYNTLREDEGESNMSSTKSLLGNKIVRVVIEAPNMEKIKDQILAIIKRYDSDNNVQYYSATQKLVGNISKAKLDSIKRDTKSKNVTITEKPLTKSLKKV